MTESTADRGEWTTTSTGKTATLLEINSLLPSYTKSERKVAQYVLAHTETVIYASVIDLAEKIGVGETTVLRFCRKIGFRSYQEFKLALAQELANPSQHSRDEVTKEDSLHAIAQKVAAFNVQAIHDTDSLLDVEQLERCVQIILEARNIHFYGVGTSGVTALDAKYKCLRIGLRVDAFSDAHLQAMAASTLEPGDVAVGISVSGSTKDTIDALKLAKEAGASVICLTHYRRSPITQHADITLLTAAKQGPLEGGSLAAKIAQLHVIDVLCTAVSQKMSDKALTYKQKTAKAVLDKVYEPAQPGKGKP
ncbi:MurR/RpiR family transcriptional regulator [Brevibacillus borstelensis]|uniref:MurR/RpiR family transcriptional regulator n=1 Tax=Brevibacillus borstelensis TaxID=45462 RepID=UPI00203ECE18|nr:MurR/RpiR family transcriptional regulator [Brevibacillus borstelensis]MCM3623851.1 MurR/RpiR family transcriptional regulator [Brevibacillus borstelensis]